jgi:DNA-binding transcriptional MerR regulator
MRDAMPQEYTISELAKVAGVTPRTIRYYVARGLLPAPTQSGPGARYAEAHLHRLRLIRKLQAAHLPLAEIRARLERLPDEQIDSLATSEPEAAVGPPESALEYIRRVVSPPRVIGRPPTFGPPRVVTPAAATVARAPAPTAQTPGPSTPTPAPSAPAPSAPPPATPPSTALPPATSQWERVALHPDIELHVRRPLTRQLNKRVDQLIQIARSLFEEE